MAGKAAGSLPVTREIGGRIDLDRSALLTALTRFILALKEEAEATHEAGDRPLYEKYLANAAVIVAKVEQDKRIDADVAFMDRLFGNTWLKDEDSARRIGEEWDVFKGLLGVSIHGMTVNERLSTLGLVEPFDLAVERGDEPELRSILSRCFLDADSIEAIIRRHLGRR